jgi:hypothetical protein
MGDPLGLEDSPFGALSRGLGKIFGPKKKAVTGRKNQDTPNYAGAYGDPTKAVKPKTKGGKSNGKSKGQEKGKEKAQKGKGQASNAVRLPAKKEVGNAASKKAPQGRVKG